MSSRQVGGRLFALVALPLVVLGAVALLLSLGETADQTVLRRLLLGGLGLSALWVVIMGADLVRALRASSTLDEDGLGDIPADESPRPRAGTEATEESTPKSLDEFDRQLETISELERTEEDPDRLQQLFTLDQSVARLRRAARGLATLSDSTLADHQPPVEPQDGVALLDVLTSALGSVEHFERVRIGAVAEVACTVELGEDVAHLVSELVDVGVRHSPANQAVEVAAGLSNLGDKLLVQVLDGGEAKAKRLKVTNSLFSNPLQPVHDPEHLGLAIASRLGLRLRGSLIAERGRQGRTLTTLALDPNLFVERSDDQPGPLGPMPGIVEPPPTDSAGRPSMLDRLKRRPSEPGRDETSRPDPGTKNPEPQSVHPDDRRPDLKAPRSLQEALGEPTNFDSGLEALLNDGSANPEIGPDGDNPSTQAPTDHPRPGPDRKPNDVRSRLSRYRRGLDSGRNGGQRPDDDQSEDGLGSSGPVKYPKPEPEGRRSGGATSASPDARPSDPDNPPRTDHEPSPEKDEDRP